MSNWESWGASPVDPNGGETVPCNHNGGKAYTTINKIKAFIAGAFEAAGAVTTGIGAHTTEPGGYDHTKIAHSNRAALDLVSGENTGDDDLSIFALKTNAEFLTDININGALVGAGPGTGTFNFVVGEAALEDNSTGSDNIAIGAASLRQNSTGNYNVALGRSALSENISGHYNVALGREAGNLITGDGNSCVGSGAGAFCISGSYNVFIGKGAGSNTNYQRQNAYNTIVIGQDTYSTKDNQVVLGNSSIVETLLNGVIRKNALDTAPVNSNATGTPGEIRFASDAIYVCIATNTWKKIAITTW
jgi:hypothetical protein